jgi:hypothetical protein
MKSSSTTPTLGSCKALAGAQRSAVQTCASDFVQFRHKKISADYLPTTCRQRDRGAVDLKPNQSLSSRCDIKRQLAVTLIMTKSKGTVLLQGRSPGRPALNRFKASLYAMSRTSSNLIMTKSNRILTVATFLLHFRNPVFNEP